MKKMKKLAVLTTALATVAVAGAFVVAPNVASATTVDVFHEVGASVRIATDVSEQGIRFVFGFEESYVGEGYEIGTIVIPDYALDGEEFTHETAEVKEIKSTKKFLPEEALTSKNVTPQAGYKYVSAALIGIDATDYNEAVYARAYYKETNGEYVYSDIVKKSIAYVASAALNAGEEDLDDALLNIVDKAVGETTLEVTGTDVFEAGETSTLTVNANGLLPVWSTSNANVATVDKTGKVTGVSAGEATIKATLGSKVVETPVYLAGEFAFNKQELFYSINASYTRPAVNNNSKDWCVLTEMDDYTSFKLLTPDGQRWNLAVVWRPLMSKTYFETLNNAGYTMTVDFGVVRNNSTETRVDNISCFGNAQVYMGEYGERRVVHGVEENIINNWATLQALQLNGTSIGTASTIYPATFLWASNYVDGVEFRVYSFGFKSETATVSVDFAENAKQLIETGENTQLVATTNQSNVVWSSSDETVAIVDQTGKVTAVAGGEAIITATAGIATASLPVYVAGAMALNENNIVYRFWNAEGGAIMNWHKANEAVEQNDHAFAFTDNGNGSYSFSPEPVNNVDGNKYASSGAFYCPTQSKAYYEALKQAGYTLSFSVVQSGGSTSNKAIYNQWCPAIGTSVTASNFEDIIITYYDALTSDWAKVPYAPTATATIQAYFFEMRNIWQRDGVITVSNFTWTKA